jgi:hypothetical protein
LTATVPRLHLRNNVAGRLFAVGLSASGVRWAQEVIREHGPEGVACVVQGKLVGERIEEAGIVAMPKLCWSPAVVVIPNEKRARLLRAEQWAAQPREPSPEVGVQHATSARQVPPC